MSLIAVGVLLAGSASATNICPASAPISTYTATGFSCMVGGLVFDTFTYSTPNIPVTVKPITTPLQEGFEFDANWSASSGGAGVFAVIAFNVNTTLDSLRLSFQGSQAAGTMVRETFNGSELLATDPLPSFSEPLFLFGSIDSPVTIANEITVIAPSAGSANISQVFNDFLTPEPIPFVTVGVGLLAVGLLRRRIKR